MGSNWGAVGYMHYSTVTYTSGADNDDICIKADQDIWAGGYLFASSDRRIKYNIEDVPDNLALNMVRKIPCRYYEYKDKIIKGNTHTNVQLVLRGFNYSSTRNSVNVNQ